MQFERLLERYPMRVYVLSIDVTRNAVQGDLTCQDTVCTWMHLLVQGHVASWEGPRAKLGVPRGIWRSMARAIHRVPSGRPISCGGPLSCPPR
eukprot:8884603-Pyramimonas_sp.AAC.1